MTASLSTDEYTKRLQVNTNRRTVTSSFFLFFLFYLSLTFTRFPLLSHFPFSLFFPTLSLYLFFYLSLYFALFSFSISLYLSLSLSTFLSLTFSLYLSLCLHMFLFICICDHTYHSLRSCFWHIYISKRNSQKQSLIATHDIIWAGGGVKIAYPTTLINQAKYEQKDSLRTFFNQFLGTKKHFQTSHQF